MAVAFYQRFQPWLLACPMHVRRWACAVHLAFIAVLSLVPSWLFPPSPVQVPGIDKLIHVAMYGVLGGLLRWAAGVRLGWRTHMALPMAAAGYGLLMEILQLGIGGAGRMFSWGDAAANLAGAALFWLVADLFLATSRQGARTAKCK